MHAFYFIRNIDNKIDKSIKTNRSSIQKNIQIFATRYKFEIYIYLPFKVHIRDKL